MAAAHGARGHASVSDHTHQQGPERGRTAAVRTTDADTKQEKQTTARGPPTPNPGRKRGVEGREAVEAVEAVVEARELLGRCLHCHHTGY